MTGQFDFNIGTRDQNVLSLALTLYKDIRFKPQRSKVLILNPEATIAEKEVIERNRLLWMLSSFYTCFDPYVSSTQFDVNSMSVVELRKLINDYSGTLNEWSVYFSAFSLILKWEMSLPESWSKLGISALEGVEVLTNFEAVKELNRTFSKRSSTKEFRELLTIEQKRVEFERHRSAISKLQTPFAQIIGLSKYNIKSARLAKYLPPEVSIYEEKYLDECFLALRRDLIIKARECNNTGKIFDIKTLLV